MVMEKFERQFEDLDVQSESMEAAVNGTAILTTPQEEIDLLMQQVADENKIELGMELGAAIPAIPAASEPSKVAMKEPDELQERLAKLRNA